MTYRYDAGRDGFIDLMELKLMMEKLGAPQTHLGLKSMIDLKTFSEDSYAERELNPMCPYVCWKQGDVYKRG